MNLGRKKKQQYMANVSREQLNLMFVINLMHKWKRPPAVFLYG